MAQLLRSETTALLRNQSVDDTVITVFVGKLSPKDILVQEIPCETSFFHGLRREKVFISVLQTLIPRILAYGQLLMVFKVCVNAPY